MKQVAKLVSNSASLECRGLDFDERIRWVLKDLVMSLGDAVSTVYSLFELRIYGVVRYFEGTGLPPVLANVVGSRT